MSKFSKASPLKLLFGNSRIYSSVRPAPEMLSSEPRSSLKAVPLAYTSYLSADKKDTKSASRNPIVIMHGLMGSKSNWNSVAKDLVERVDRRVVVADARNHGESPHADQFSYEAMAEDIRLLLESLEVRHNDSVSLIGHSMGGRAVMYYALKYPELVKDLVIVDVSPGKSFTAKKSLVSMLEAMKDVVLADEMNLSRARAEADRQLEERVKQPWIRQFLLTNLVQKDKGFAWKVNLDSILANIDNIVEFPRVDATFEKPALFVSAEKSEFLPPSDRPHISKLFPRAQFQSIDGAGHWVHVEKPQQFLAVVSQFLLKTGAHCSSSLIVY